MEIWVVIYTNGNYTDMTGTSYFKTEKEGMEEFTDLTSQDRIDYHRRDMTGFNVRLEKVTFGDKNVIKVLEEFTYDFVGDESYEY